MNWTFWRCCHIERFLFSKKNTKNLVSTNSSMRRKCFDRNLNWKTSKSKFCCQKLMPTNEWQKLFNYPAQIATFRSPHFWRLHTSRDKERTVPIAPWRIFPRHFLYNIVWDSAEEQRTSSSGAPDGYLCALWALSTVSCFLCLSTRFFFAFAKMQFKHHRNTRDIKKWN